MKSTGLGGTAAFLAAAVLVATVGCSKNTNPDTPSTPTGTAISKVGVTCAFRVAASDPDFDRLAVRVDWNNGDTSSWSELFRSGDTMTLGYAWSSPGSFKVSAQAKDEKGAVSPWSNWHVVLITDTANVPPGVPATPAGPDSGLVRTTYEFMTLAGDANGDRVYLQIDWGDGDTSAWGALVSESTQVTMSHAWDSLGEYSVRARAKDEKELVGDWSNVHVIAVTDSLE